MLPVDSRFALEVLAQFPDPASARFDAALARTSLDDEQRRELRYWQRQSLLDLRQYAASALPGALVAVGAAQQESLDAAAAAEAAWDDRAIQPIMTTDVAAAGETGVLAGPVGAGGPALVDTLELRRRIVAAKLASGA